MAPRITPFPFPIHVGTDICNISRVYSILKSGGGIRFIQKILTAEERNERAAIRHLLSVARQSPPPERPKSRLRHAYDHWAYEVAKMTPKDLTKVAEFMAGRWVLFLFSLFSSCFNISVNPRHLHTHISRFAAKEAAFKAHPHMQLHFHDIIIRYTAKKGEEGKDKSVVDGNSDSTKPEEIFKPDASGPTVAFIKAPKDRGGDEGAGQMAKVSISHDADWATAVCLGFEMPEIDMPEQREPAQVEDVR
ncbi:hypothetical protein B0T17DRAFT_311591 [Bombardia bombarda]|uniref:4'-phosphopantetheinyl transferase domain-containing protein n=1 Tax=Bombardia bombarda TaxID=252184 RepID=A0AA40BY37_9PEZI|nr:hypothetical protein B0T17DRAFT_311591 [Bombardia bombarda]